MFDKLTSTPPDALMRAAREFTMDMRPEKINLGIGIYYDDEGRIPILQAVREAEQRFIKRDRPWSYLLAEGFDHLIDNALRLSVGDIIADEITSRTTTLQTVGGTGAIRLGAEIIKSLSPRTVVAVSKPSWPNHEAILRAVGLEVRHYAYHDTDQKGVDIQGMCNDIENLPPGSVVVLHACCHNPTGWDPTEKQWIDILDVIMRRRLVPFFDMAYQGFGNGLFADSFAVRAMIELCDSAFIAMSFSKSFALYGERVGALCVLTGGIHQARLVSERARAITRTLHSSPPTHGALLVSEIFKDNALRGLWQNEVEDMRLRIARIRADLITHLNDGNNQRDFSFIADQKGLFSYSSLNPSQISILRDKFAIHAVDDGRICLAALNTGNIGRVAEAIHHVCMQA